MESYDFVIIGGGGTGLAAAMYAGRLGMKTLVIGFTHGSELSIGGVITTTNSVENYPGFKKISGYELAKNLAEHAKSYSDFVSMKNEKVEEVKKDKKGFLIKTSKGEYFGKTILFATGTKWKKLNVPGGRELENLGVNYCALCDGPLYKKKTVAVYGGGDSAAKDALILAEHADKVYIIYRGEKIRPEPINLARVENNQKIEIISKTHIVAVNGKEKVESLTFNNEFNGSKNLKVDAVFIAIGHEVLSELAKKLGVEINSHGEIILDHKTSETNVKGVFAAGDVTDKPFKQLITGVADGCTAAYSAYEYITKQRLED